MCDFVLFSAFLLRLLVRNASLKMEKCKMTRSLKGCKTELLSLYRVMRFLSFDTA